MNAHWLEKLTIRGFKSIKQLDDFELRPLNVLIGANGAGKSNFVEVFRLLRAIVEQRLQEYANRNGPSDGYFFNGVKHTRRIEVELHFGRNRYAFRLEPTAERGLLIAQELTQYTGVKYSKLIAQGTIESRLKDLRDEPGRWGSVGPNWHVWSAVTSWRVYHFHDTSMTAGMRRDGGIEQTEQLDSSGDNLAPFLLGLRNEHPGVYDAIRKTTQRIAPYFDDFLPKIRKGKKEDQVRLTWKQKGTDYIFSPGYLSDGTIRFLCLTTALLQPTPPSMIVIDEPELGLHPEALSILAGLLKSASERMQIIVATQSPALLSEFDPKDVITVDQVDGATQLARLDRKRLRSWLKDFSLGELWMKGTVRGGVNDA